MLALNEHELSGQSVGYVGMIHGYEGQDLGLDTNGAFFFRGDIHTAAMQDFQTHVSRHSLFSFSRLNSTHVGGAGPPLRACHLLLLSEVQSKQMLCHIDLQINAKVENDRNISCA
jgi:hypothetical protein